LIQKVIARNLSHEKFYVFLFGSRAIGNEGFRSDIDVSLMGESAVSFGTLDAFLSCSS
jgi:predicted nucleotidyltransferase